MVNGWEIEVEDVKFEVLGFRLYGATLTCYRFIKEYILHPRAEPKTVR